MTNSAPDLANLPVNCPRCGKPMLYVRARTPGGETLADREAANGATIYVYHCAEHGLFQFSRDIPVRSGG